MNVTLTTVSPKSSALILPLGVDGRQLGIGTGERGQTSHVALAAVGIHGPDQELLTFALRQNLVLGRDFHGDRLVQFVVAPGQSLGHPGGEHRVLRGIGLDLRASRVRRRVAGLEEDEALDRLHPVDPATHVHLGQGVVIGIGLGAEH